MLNPLCVFWVARFSLEAYNARMNWPSILLTAALSGIMAVIGIVIKQSFDRGLEERKARWGRASWVHQKQVEALSKIYGHFNTLNSYLMGATRAGRFENEASPETYLARLHQEQESTVSDYVDVKLIIPKRVADQCESYLKQLQGALTKLAIGKVSFEMGNPIGFAEEWKEALTIAYTQIPSLLEEIESSARQIIHEESN
jgi:hypothetical protein